MSSSLQQQLSWEETEINSSSFPEGLERLHVTLSEHETSRIVHQVATNSQQSGI